MNLMLTMAKHCQYSPKTGSSTTLKSKLDYLGLTAAILKDMLNQSATMDRVFQALADPSRRGMVDRLCRGPASVSELAQPLSMSLAAVVQHLQVLEASGLIRSEKVGRVRTCRIEPVALTAAERWIGQRRAQWESRLNRPAAGGG
jgi:DNA-binding transcriptional ArsR family regulator